MRPTPAWARIAACGAALALGLRLAGCGGGDEGPASSPSTVEEIAGLELQPLSSSVRRLLEALDHLGAPLAPAHRERLESALAEADAPAAVRTIQELLDPYCLALVRVNPESRVKVEAGPAPKRLLQGGWRTFLVKVRNEAGVTAPLRVRSPNAAPPFQGASGSPEPSPALTPRDVADRFLEVDLPAPQPLAEALSGLALEYRVIQLYSRDAGKREAVLGFDVGQGTQDLGFRGERALLFDCAPAVEVTLEVLDDVGRPTTASFVFRDEDGHVYPAPGRRQAPDFSFQEQVYRRSGESVLLAPGRYEVRFTRGPEYVAGARTIEVPDAPRHTEQFQLQRWIHPAAEGWRSGDHHIHAAGCAHYESPTQGVTPLDMLRHIQGEGLDVGCVLSWGPCWYHQKRFFEGGVSALSTADHLMRYDVEVSGFPSSHAGHLALLGLREDDFPGSERIEDWPSWNLPILEWARGQGAVAGYCHSGFGLEVSGSELPSYEMPRFDGIGANEYIVDVTQGAVDFISATDTPFTWELSIWYHTLNCGFRTRLSGETDFPCIYGERVGLGRAYVRMPAAPLDFDTWVRGLRDGRSYVSDGRSHLLDFTLAGLPVGEAGPSGRPSEVRLDAPGEVVVSARAAAWLDPAGEPGLHGLPLDQQPYWHLERARIAGTRRVTVELVVNGRSVDSKELEADGRIVPIRFDARIERSSWVALRILPSSHTNPVFVLVGDRPVRSSRRSAAWCLEAVDVCWGQKAARIRAGERDAARAAYEHAREAYRAILDASESD